VPRGPHEPVDPRQGEPLGRRIAEHRQKLGWTQQQLADRLAVTRAAVSHLEAGMSVPGERTVALLAGAFHTEPHDLVAGTDYPSAKADRLPLVAARYTEADHQLRLLEHDLRWIEAAPPAQAEHELRAWLDRLAALAAVTVDLHERSLLAEARALARAALDALHR
jgi:transcriptional regulator with XRE-family HTH domain